MSDDNSEILSGLNDMYDSFVRGDRQRFDTHLDEELTAWESHLPRLLDRQGLDSYRDRRTPDQVPRLAELRIVDPAIDVWGDRALARYELVSVPVDEHERVEVRRVTDVLRRTNQGWRIIHHHAERVKVPVHD